MTRRLLTVDRVVGLLVGLALIAVALLTLDWRYRVVGTYGSILQTNGVQSTLGTSWWPWVFAAVALVLGLIALAWILAHLRRRGPGDVRMSASNENGRLEVDMRAVASAAAEYLGSIAPLVDVRGTTRTYGGCTVLELSGHVDPGADAHAITEGARTCTEHVTMAFPDERVECRVLLDAPRRTRPGRDNRVRVR